MVTKFCIILLLYVSYNEKKMSKAHPPSDGRSDGLAQVPQTSASHGDNMAGQEEDGASRHI